MFLGGWLINDEPGEVGEETLPDKPDCQAANRPDGENPIEQVERLAFSHGQTGSRAQVRAYITAQRDT